MEKQEVYQKPPMHERAAEFYAQALENLQPESADLEVLLQLSIVSERIAEDLWMANCLKAGKAPSHFPDLPPLLKDRFRLMAERAIRTTDHEFLVKAQQQASLLTDEEVNGRPCETPYDLPSTLVVARHAVAAYEYIVSKGIVPQRDEPQSDDSH